jgi:hypothetical protein
VHAGSGGRLDVAHGVLFIEGVHGRRALALVEDEAGLVDMILVLVGHVAGLTLLIEGVVDCEFELSEDLVVGGGLGHPDDSATRIVEVDPPLYVARLVARGRAGIAHWILYFNVLLSLSCPDSVSWSVHIILIVLFLLVPEHPEQSFALVEHALVVAGVVWRGHHEVRVFLAYLIMKVFLLIVFEGRSNVSLGDACLVVLDFEVLFRLGLI